MREKSVVPCPVRNPKTGAVVLDYCAGKLDPAATQLFETHLETCAECKRLTACQRSIWTALDAFEPPPVTTGFNRTLFNNVDLHESSSWWRRALAPNGSHGFYSGWLRPAMPLGLACSAILAVFLIGGREATNVPPASQTMVKAQAKSERVDVEQVEQALEDMEMLRQLTPQAGGQGTARSL